MSIEIVTPASSYNLTTVETVKNQLSISDPDKEVKIPRLIKVASDFIKSYCRRDFAQEEITETIPGFGMANLLLSRTPIVSVSEVTFNGSPVTDYSIKDYDAGILYNKSGWNNTSLLYPGLTDHPIPNSEENLYSVTYIAGFVLPSMDKATRNLPYEIEEAAIEFIADQLDRQSGNLKSVRVGDYSATFGDGVSAKIEKLLSRWVRHEF